MIVINKFIKSAAILIGLSLFTACGANEDDATTSTDTTTTITTWNQANTLIGKSCSASGCHGTSGAGSVVYQDSQTVFESASQSAISGMTSKGVSSADITALNTYLKSL